MDFSSFVLRPAWLGSKWEKFYTWKSGVRNNKYVRTFTLSLSNRTIVTSVTPIQRYRKYRSRPVIETHYSPNVRLVSLSPRRVKPRDRARYRAEVPAYRRSISPSLSPFSSKGDPTSARGGSCTVTSDPYRTINASSATIKRARRRTPRLSGYYK